MRLAFSILFNAEHHLVHNNYIEKILNMFDYWSVVEGPAESSGSTSWCKEIPEECCVNGMSSDATIEILKRYYLDSKYANKIMFSRTSHMMGKVNKDVMVNLALRYYQSQIKYNIKPDFVEDNIYLWEIDADEQWTEEDLAAAEKYLEEHNGTTGMFHCDYWVGKNLKAVGEWGEGKKLPYKRLWKWRGESFKTHEPPEMDIENNVEVLCPQRFQHYAYYFEKDVKFKDAWYSGHEGVYDNWLSLQKETNFPQPISRLISGPWGKTNTQIIQTE